jgi:hypothetical protein
LIRAHTLPTKALTHENRAVECFCVSFANEPSPGVEVRPTNCRNAFDRNAGFRAIAFDTNVACHNVHRPRRIDQFDDHQHDRARHNNIAAINK